jgi:hypothetical protein
MIALILLARPARKRRHRGEQKAEGFLGTDQQGAQGQ